MHVIGWGSEVEVTVAAPERGDQGLDLVVGTEWHATKRAWSH